MTFTDTIFALSSGRLPSGVAIIRISGADARRALDTLTGPLPPERTVALRRVRDASGGLIDTALVHWFAAPRSFTGEDCAELHLHGGKAVVEAALSRLSSLPGMRHALAGEFTRRAFANGKVDLVEAEGLADLVAAETEAQRRFAVANAQGLQSRLYAGWRQRIVQARAMIEAELDFSDEGDVPGSVAEEVWRDMAALAGEIARHLADYHRAEIVRDGFNVVILGAPNAGKSSLLNALARRDVAIVTPEPGTTRDLVRVELDLGGVKVVVTDTAGIREEAGTVEALGIERALASAANADLVILLQAVEEPTPRDFGEFRDTIAVLSKADLLDAGARQTRGTGFDHLISVVDGSGVDGLVCDLAARAARATGDLGDPLPSRLRHVEQLERCGKALLKAGDTAAALELRAEELRAASAALGGITGDVNVEDLLDAIFSQFCIGK